MSRPSTGRKKARAAKKRKIAAFAMLLGLLAVIWGRNFVGSAIGKAAATSASPGVEATTTSGGGMLSAVHLEWPPEMQRDPFVLDRSAYELQQIIEPPQVQERPDLPSEAEVVASARRELSLQAVILSNIPRAIINGRGYRVGDTVNGFNVREIEDRRVVLVKDQVVITLEM